MTSDLTAANSMASSSISPGSHERIQGIKSTSSIPVVPSESSESTVEESVKSLTIGVKERYDDIFKHEKDSKEYRGLLLNNRMKVLLISQPDVVCSAAALEVQVGSYSDPDDIPGLAHFCEHMLFLGTEKYPEENEYEKYISEHGGQNNAFTNADSTIYFFNISPLHLEHALDIFAQFFISPLFTESATSRELNAVNSEHENLSSDDRRLLNLNKYISDPTHPYKKFCTGNKETLKTTPESKGIDIRKELLKFHEQWYSSNIMSLVVIGKESLDELEAMVAPLFSTIKDKSVTAPSWPLNPIPLELRRKKIYGVPIKDTRELTIDFAIPCQLIYYKSKPADYLSHLIRHRGPGSLLSALKRRGWCSGISSSAITPARDFAFFYVQVEITNEGIKHTDDIVSLIFQYLAMLKEVGPQRWLWEEQSHLMELKYLFNDVRSSTDIVREYAPLLQDYPMEDVPSIHNLITEWKPELITDLLSLLIPVNAVVTIAAKAFEDKCTMTDPWYGTKYGFENIDESTLKNWTEVQLCEELHMPPPNEFIPTTLTTGKEVTPTIVKDTKLMRLWYKKNAGFLGSQGKIIFRLFSPVIDAEPFNIYLCSFWLKLVCERIQELTYGAVQAGMDWKVTVNEAGINIAVEGYEEKLDILLYKIIDQFVEFKADPKRFQILRADFFSSQENGINDMQPADLAVEEEEACLSGWHLSASFDSIVRELLKRKETDQDAGICAVITDTSLPYKTARKSKKQVVHMTYYYVCYKTARSFVKKLRLVRTQLLTSFIHLTSEQLDNFAASFIRKVHIEGLIYGEINRERAIMIGDSVEEKFPKDGIPLFAAQLLPYRSIELDRGAWYVRKMETKVHRESCASVYYDCGMNSMRESLILKFLLQLLKEPCYTTLRTKEQLGYSVYSDIVSYNGGHGLRIRVQGERHPEYLEHRIEEFVQNFLEILQNMSHDEEILKAHCTLIGNISERKGIAWLADEMWSEITYQVYNFDRARLDLEELEQISKEDLIAFYEKYFSQDSSDRAKLSIHVLSIAEGGAGEEESKTTEEKQEENAKEVDDKEKPLSEDSPHCVEQSVSAVTALEKDADKGDSTPSTQKQEDNATQKIDKEEPLSEDSPDRGEEIVSTITSEEKEESRACEEGFKPSIQKQEENATQKADKEKPVREGFPDHVEQSVSAIRAVEKDASEKDKREKLREDSSDSAERSVRVTIIVKTNTSEEDLKPPKPAQEVKITQKIDKIKLQVKIMTDSTAEENIAEKHENLAVRKAEVEVTQKNNKMKLQVQIMMNSTTEGRKSEEDFKTVEKEQNVIPRVVEVLLQPDIIKDSTAEETHGKDGFKLTVQKLEAKVTQQVGKIALQREIITDSTANVEGFKSQVSDQDNQRKAAQKVDKVVQQLEVSAIDLSVYHEDFGITQQKQAEKIKQDIEIVLQQSEITTNSTTKGGASEDYYKQVEKEPKVKVTQKADEILLQSEIVTNSTVERSTSVENFKTAQQESKVIQKVTLPHLEINTDSIVENGANDDSFKLEVPEAHITQRADQVLLQSEVNEDSTAEGGIGTDNLKLAEPGSQVILIAEKVLLQSENILDSTAKGGEEFKSIELDQERKITQKTDEVLQQPETITNLTEEGDASVEKFKQPQQEGKVAHKADEALLESNITTNSTTEARTDDDNLKPVEQIQKENVSQKANQILLHLEIFTNSSAEEETSGENLKSEEEKQVVKVTQKCGKIQLQLKIITDSTEVVRGDFKGVEEEQDESITQRTDKVLQQPEIITDLLEFKSRRRLYPNPIPFMDIPRKGL